MFGGIDQLPFPTRNSLPWLPSHSSVLVVFIVSKLASLPSPLYQMGEGILEGFVIESLFSFVYRLKIKSSLLPMKSA